MPIPKSKTSPPKIVGKGKASTAGGADEFASTGEKNDTSGVVLLAGGKPDKQAYEREQNRIKGEIDALQLKLNAVREKINLATQPGANNDRKAALKAELDSIRDQQSSKKLNRSKLMEQLKGLQDNLQKKVKDLQNAKAKIPYKTAEEIDARIQQLEKQVESGTMKLADEKRALQEISSVKRSRRIVEGFQADQDAVEADRQQIDEIKKHLDDPEAKAISEKFETIKAELDEIKKQSDEAYAGRNKLFEERDAIQSQIKTFLTEKRDKQRAYREANDRYWTKVNEDRAKRAERLRAQRAAEEAQKKQEIAQRLREEASIPAFQAEIEDCQTLIDFFSGKTTGNVTYKSTAASQSAKMEVAGVPKLEIRKVEDVPEGAIIRKKKGEDEEAYFVGGKGKKGGKKGGGAALAPSPTPTSTSKANDNLNLPFATLTALLSLSIPAPESQTDIDRVIEDLKTKKVWFEANQARITAENVAKAEAEIARLTQASKDKASDAVTVDGAETPASEDPSSSATPAEIPLEPVPTPQIGDVASNGISSHEVDEKLETVKEVTA